MLEVYRCSIYYIPALKIQANLENTFQLSVNIEGSTIIIFITEQGHSVPQEQCLMLCEGVFVGKK